MDSLIQKIFQIFIIEVQRRHTTKINDCHLPRVDVENQLVIYRAGLLDNKMILVCGQELEEFKIQWCGVAARGSILG